MAVTILCIAGARPNFMKVAPLLRALAGNPRFEPRLVHTGQHYDEAMNDVFFRELGALYSAFAAGLPNPLPELPLQYAAAHGHIHGRMRQNPYAPSA